MNRSIALLSTLLGAITLASRAGAQATRVDLELRLDAEGAATLEHVAQLAGTLSVWAESAELDLTLRLESGDGAALAQDDDTGGGRNPWIRRGGTLAGERFVLHVQAKNPAGPATIRLSVRELPEDDRSRLAMENALAALAEARDRAARGASIEAAEQLSQAIDSYGATEGIRASLSFHRTLMEMARQSAVWLDFDTYLRASLVRREAMRGLFPPTSEAWSEVHHAVCLGAARAGSPGTAVVECEAALERATLCHPPGHANIPITRLALAQAHLAARELERAAAQFEQASAEADASPALGDLERAMIRGELGSLLFELGILHESVRMQRECLAVLSERLPADDERVVTAKTNLAAVLAAIGDSREALALEQDCASARAASLPEDHAVALQARYNVATTQLALGEAALAAQEFERLRELQERAGLRLGDFGDSLDVALAQAWRQSGRAEEAVALLMERERTRREEGRRDSSTGWRITSTLAHCALELGREEEARRHAEAALELARVAFPSGNPDRSEALQLAAALALRAGEHATALARAREAVADARGHFSRCALTLTMRQAESAQSHWSRLVSDGLALLEATRDEACAAENDRLAFELAESARGIGLSLLRGWNAEARAAAEHTGHVRSLREAALAATRRVTELGARGETGAELQSALDARTRAELALRDAYRAALGGADLAALSTDDLARSLAPDEAAIGYWRTDTRELGANATAPRAPRLLAFVLRADGRVHRFDLGPLAPIEALVQRWRTAAASGDTASAEEETASGTALFRLIVEPLSGALAGARAWRVALDDVLHTVALDALSTGKGRVGDSVVLTLTPSLTQRPATRTEGGGKGLLVLGGVDYELAEDAQEGTRLALARSLRDASGWTDFEPLWETQDEIDGVASVFRRARPEGGGVTELSERGATRDALLESAPRASFLHVATHGFFAPGSTVRADPSQGLLADRAPLALCGLALAGANDPDPRARLAAVVTADELAALDLSRCELAVLSACDTGAGTLSAGQGVASFQKALHAAGARRVITSLWKVDDAASREWMLAFYEALWVRGESPELAVRSARAALRERRAPTRDWAGWTISR